MNFAGILTILQQLLPALGATTEPLILSEWTTVGLPKLQAIVAGIQNPTEQFIASEGLKFLDAVAQYEIKLI